MRCRSSLGTSAFDTTALILIVLLVSLVAVPAGAEQRNLGVVGRQAPSWNLEWLNLPDGVTSLDVEDFRGKMLYVFCFQSWCPGCHSHGFPALQEVEQHFRDNEDVHFVAIQTVFEGFGTNTANRALEEIKDYGLEIPVAHDAGDRGLSPFMRAYRSGGTPWTILIDPDGKVVWNGFQLDSSKAIQQIEQILARQAAEEPSHE